ncbi:hypothetical protein [Helicobacter macacae]|uniref:Uncharacterized protein n=1 Tax=Helicobacter macacae MIT 99-5501 TaxID=1357400 RepID=V8CCN8_9HELI|nr:hypothetical protein [Helicobacter macacae]ETD25183.1 hypothetical protein HMPREF2086_00518 [Helicobacter macacae MIT 99-5501]
MDCFVAASPLPRNDGVVDCHEFANANSRNDEKVRYNDEFSAFFTNKKDTHPTPLALREGTSKEPNTATIRVGSLALDRATTHAK